jgi:flavin-dependent dehydrogenase
MHVDTDLRIMGGGSAGGMAASAARAHAPAVAVTILEKG